MSKLTFILCVALFASAANASYWSDAVENVQKPIQGIIDTAIRTVENQFEAAQQKAFVVAEKLHEKALDYAQKVVDRITVILRNVQKEVDKLTGKAEGVDITECTKLAAHLDQTALTVMSNMSVCVVDKIELGAGYIETMIKISNDLLGNLTALKDEVGHCSDNVTNISTGLKAIACTNMLAVKATATTIKAVPAFTINIAKLTYLLTLLQPSLVYCSTTNGLVTFYHESSTIIDRTKRCIQQKIDEVRDAEPDAHTTRITEEPLITHHVSTTDEHKYTTSVPQLTEEQNHDDFFAQN